MKAPRLTKTQEHVLAELRTVRYPIPAREIRTLAAQRHGFATTLRSLERHGYVASVYLASNRFADDDGLTLCYIATPLGAQVAPR